MNILWEEFAKEGDVGLPRGRYCYEGEYWSNMREGWLEFTFYVDHVETKERF